MKKEKNFESNDKSIFTILNGIDSGEYQLPEFQRDWVWDDERIRALIASISNYYPIGALMFLTYEENSLDFQYRSFDGAEYNDKPKILVLDGQQRLTSMYRAMYHKSPVDTKLADKKNKIKRYYYLDIKKCIDNCVERIDAIISIAEEKMLKSSGNSTLLDLSSLENEYKNHMFPLNRIFDSNKWQMEYLKFYNFDTKIIEEYEKFQESVVDTIKSYHIPVITLNGKNSKESICQIFESVNTGGISLTIFELMTATFAKNNFDLRKDWNRIHKNFDEKSSKTTPPKQKSILSTISPVHFLTALNFLSRYYKGETITGNKKDIFNLKLEDYQKYANILSEGFLKSDTFIKEQRIFSERDLPYSTQLIPLSVIFSILDDKEANNSNIREKISRWYWCGIFGEMYGGLSNEICAKDVKEVMGWLRGGHEPETIQKAFFQKERLLELRNRQSAAYKGIIALILKEGCLDFISGREMDLSAFLDEIIDIHHIFPKKYCESQGIDKEKYNSIINKTPLSSNTNKIIGGNRPSIYLSKIEEKENIEADKLNNFLISHKINVEYIRKDSFKKYFEKREKELLDLIAKVMGKKYTKR